MYEVCLGESNILELDSAFSSIIWNDGSIDPIRTIYQSVDLWVSYIN
ncbi:hypothetical protein OAD66_05820 [Bacteroidia bacterium]|nr:hypothetical protein [Bacteroidia bacterium]